MNQTTTTNQEKSKIGIDRIGPYYMITGLTYEDLYCLRETLKGSNLANSIKEFQDNLQKELQKIKYQQNMEVINTLLGNKNGL